MSFDVRYIIDNTEQRPFYSLYFYTKYCLKIHYDKKSKFKWQKVGKGVSLDLNVG